jgi:hypothetical protein
VSYAGEPVAWEDDSVPFPANLGLTWWDCLTSPDRFFSRLSWEGTVARPILYYVIVAILGGMLSLFWLVWSPWGAANQLGLTLEQQLLIFFLTPFAVLLALGLATSIQHLFVLMLAPERRGFGATATVFCYSSGVGLLTAVLPPAFGFGAAPGGLFGSVYLVVYSMLAFAVQLWYVAVLVFGMRRAHSTTTGRAIAIVLLPIGVGFAVALGLAIVAAALIALVELPV